MGSQRSTNLILATLFLGMFVLGSAELLVVGVLNRIAADLRISLPAAGALVTANALGLAVGGPLLTAMTIRLNRRTVLIGALALFILGNLVPVLTTSYGLFLGARIGVGALQGVFIAAAFAAGTSVVPPERAGRAIAVVISGVTVSAALGVPLGTLVGQALDWRGSFAAVVAVAAVALVATVAWVPSVPSAGGGLRSQARYAFAPRVLAVLLLTCAVFAAVYATLTFIVPFLEGVTGVAGPLVSAFLLAYGVATAVGSFGGGRFADRNAARTAIIASVGVTVSLAVLYLLGAIAVVVVLALMGWGLFAFGMVPALQQRVVSLAGPGGGLAQSLPASAANVGIALGSYLGGTAVDRFTTSAAVATGLIIAAIAVLLSVATGFLRPPIQPTESGGDHDRTGTAAGRDVARAARGG